MSAGSTKPVRSTIFDLDDTLIIEEEVARASLGKVAGLLPDRDPAHVADVLLTTAQQLWRAGPYRQICFDLGIASWEGLWATFEGGHPVLDGLRDWARTYRPAVWRQALATLGIEDPTMVEAMAALYLESQRRGHRLIVGADSLVHSIRGTRRIGLLTNGPPDIQRLKFEGTGLADCFDAVVVSGEVGVGKPDPAVFALVLERLGTTAENTVMVGDNWERDVVGALQVGMTAVWIAGGRPRPAEVAGVTVVDHVGQLTADDL
ncbi:MAG TPA: HAD family hydrolase [Acidimicrobiales bacterium]